MNENHKINLKGHSSSHSINGFIPSTEPDYLELYSWEKFNYNYWQVWFASNWIISIYLVLAYVTVVFSLKFWMKNRHPYKLQNILVLWNLALAIFSIIGTVRMFPELFNILQQPNGLHESVCNIDKMHMGTVFWCLAATFSKAFELGDTVFIVLRKQPLIFLHWYHHATVLTYSWYTYYYHDAGHRWFVPINLFIHSVMYSYYAVRAMGVKVPRNFAMIITSTQLLQMFVGIGVNGYALYSKRNGLNCQTPTFNLTIALLMYLSYAVLFANFFVQSYVKKGRRKQKTL